MRNVERRIVRGIVWYPNRAQPWPKSAHGGITGAGTSRPLLTVRSPTGPVRSEPGVPETGVAGASQQQLIDRVEGQGVFCCGQCELEPVFAWVLPCADTRPIGTAAATASVSTRHAMRRTSGLAAKFFIGSNDGRAGIVPPDSRPVPPLSGLSLLPDRARCGICRRRLCDFPHRCGARFATLARSRSSSARTSQ